MTDEILDGYNEFRKRQQKAHGDYDWGSFSAGTELIERKYKGKLYSERCHSMHDMKEETRLKEYWKEQDEEWQKKVEELRDVIEEFHGRTDMGLWNEVKVEINRIFGKVKKK